MNAFLGELGKKLAERYVSVLVAPGLLFLFSGAVAAILGHSDALNISLLRDEIESVAADPRSRGAGLVVVMLVAVLLGSALAGLLAVAAGVQLQRLWSTSARRWPFSALTRRRARRWRAANEQAHAATRAAALAASSRDVDSIPMPERVELLFRRRNAVFPTEPRRPTWIGDRLDAVDRRAHQGYALDLSLVWPRLWPLLPEHVRTDIGVAHDSYTSSARQLAWGLMYVALGAWWWPSALVGVAVVVSARIRARSAVTVLSDLLDSAVDLYGQTLAEALRLPGTGAMTRELGALITARLANPSRVEGDG